MTDEEIVAEAARRLGQAVPDGSQVILFGSRARGDARADSDFDLIVIEPEVEHTLLEAARLRGTLAGLPGAIDVVVLDLETVNERSRVPGSMTSRALEEGRVIAGASA